MASGARISNDPAAEMSRRLKQAVKDVEDLGQVWTASHLGGKIDVKAVSKGEGRLAAAAFAEATEYAREVASSAIREALDVAVSSSSWNWRTGGSRDIVDTGELKNSLDVSIQGNDIVVFYGAPYASIIHEGGYIRPYGNTKIDAVYLPGRPWVDAVLYGGGPVPSVDLDQIIGNAIDSRLR